MRKSVTAIVLIVAAVLLVPVITYGAGLGKLTVHSALGQPLDAEIEILSLQPGDEGSFQARLASREAFRQAGVDLSSVLASARFAIERRGGKSVIRITTTQPVNDPFLNIMVELQWPSGRLAREYTVLIDPVEFKSAAMAAAPAQVKPQLAAGAPAAAAQVERPVVAPAPVAGTAPAPVPASAAPQAQVPTSAQSGAPLKASPQSEAAAAAPVSAPASARVGTAPVPASAPSASAAPAAAPGPSPASTLAPVVAAIPAPSKTATNQASADTTAQATAAPSRSAASRTAAVSAGARATQAAGPATAVRAAKPVPEAMAAGTYRIKRGDTLGAIARRWKPDGVTLNQMLIALYQGNRQVFIRDNINLIRAGATLAIPAQEQVAAINAEQAFQQVMSQMASFAHYRRHRGATVAEATTRTAVERREATVRRVAVRKSARSM